VNAAIGNLPSVLVTGANRGIGLEFARQYAEEGWSVIACCRTPAEATDLRALAAARPNLAIAPLDVTDHHAIESLAGCYRGRPIDVLINNAGMLGALPLRDNLHRQHFGSLDYELWGEVLRVNTLGPVKMAEAFLEHVAASRQKKIVAISSTVGSIAESRRAAFAYTTSKAALNKAMTLVAELVQPRGVIVGIFCPGYVKTRMNIGGATVEIPDSVSGMRRLIAELGPADGGSFRRYNGEPIAW
jgi:NAD(P)-dependent dehydrogenase (short-subunit alcohol dehydrogenase family)